MFEFYFSLLLFVYVIILRIIIHFYCLSEAFVFIVIICTEIFIQTLNSCLQRNIGLGLGIVGH